jgi:putative endonuclease
VKLPAVYMMASGRGGTLYVGVTSDLVRRVGEHRAGAMAGFTARYGCKVLVWFEMYEGMEAAILREKQIKAGSRAAKIGLILAGNPLWADLWPGLVGEG